MGMAQSRPTQHESTCEAGSPYSISTALGSDDYFHVWCLDCRDGHHRSAPAL